MNILFLEQYSKISGGQLCLLELIENLDQASFNSHVAVPEEGELTKRLAGMKIGFSVLPVGTYTQGKKTVFDAIKMVVNSILVIPKLIRVIKEQKIDVVYANAPRTFLWGTIAARMTGLPVVWHLHLILNGQKEKLLARWLLKLGVDHVICVSQAVADSFITGSHRPKQLSIVYNGTELSKYSPEVCGDSFREEFGLSPKQPAIGVIGQIAAAKGQETFIRAAATILRKFPEAKFFVVGGTSYSSESERFLGYLKQLVQESAMENNVIFTGPRSDVPNVLAGLDIVVLPSLVPEACPRVLIETVATGKVIVATNNGAAPELITEGKDGFLFFPGEAGQLVNIVESLLHNPLMQENVNKDARKLAESKFDLLNYVGEISRILNLFRL